MSKKLDYFTITIVALCIIAIIFLLYKMTDLLSGNKSENPIKDAVETVVDTDDSAEGEGDDIYDYDLESDTDSGEEIADLDNTPEDGASLNEEEDSGINFTEEEEEEDAIEPEPEQEETPVPAEQPSTISSSYGKYQVIAGTFKIKENGDKFAVKLRQLNYSNAQSVIFDKGTYAVVLVDSFDDLASARKLKKDLEADGYETYIKTAKN